MRRILICLLLLALLCGCTGQMLPAGKSKFTFYYRRADAQNDESYVSASGALAEKEVTLGGDVRTEDVLAAYFEDRTMKPSARCFRRGRRVSARSFKMGCWCSI